MDEAYIRGILISIGARKKKERIKNMEKLIKEIYDLEQRHEKYRGRDQELYQALVLKRDELKDLMEQETRRVFSRISKERYQWGNKVSKHLARMLKKKISKLHRKNPKQKRGNGICDKRNSKSVPELLWDVILGKPKGATGNRKNRKDKRIPKKAKLTQIIESRVSSLETPVAEEEINMALKESASGKSPGLDGFTTYYLKKFKEILTPKLCLYMNGLGTRYEMTRENLLASITIISKEGKDSTLCSSYRPISLLNADTKLFEKVLATRMKDLMTDLVHADQAGFIPGREGRDNSVRTLLLLQKIRKGTTPGLLLSTDAKKAFDRVDWGIMMNTLENMEIGPRMIRFSGSKYYINILQQP